MLGVLTNTPTSTLMWAVCNGPQANELVVIELDLGERSMPLPIIRYSAKFFALGTQIFVLVLTPVGSLHATDYTGIAGLARYFELVIISEILNLNAKWKLNLKLLNFHRISVVTIDLCLLVQISIQTK